MGGPVLVPKPVLHAPRPAGIQAAAAFALFFGACGTTRPSEQPSAPPPAVVAPSEPVAETAVPVVPPEPKSVPLLSTVPRVPLNSRDEQLLEIIGGSVASGSDGLQIFSYFKQMQRQFRSFQEAQENSRIAQQMAENAWAEFSRDPQLRWKAITTLYHDNENIQRAGIYALFSTGLERDRQMLRGYVLDPSAPAPGRQYAFDHVFQKSEWTDAEIAQFRQDPALAHRAYWIWLKRLPREEAVPEALARYEQERKGQRRDSLPFRVLNNDLREFIRERGGHIESKHPYIIAVDGDNFAERVLSHKGLAVVYTWRDGCPGCDAIEPVFKQLVENNTSPYVTFFSFDADRTAMDAKVYQRYTTNYSYPGFLFFINGQLIDHFTGSRPSQLRQKLRKYSREAERRSMGDEYFRHSSEAKNPHITQLTPDNFDSLLEQQKGIIIVDVSKSACGACRYMAPFFERWAGQFSRFGLSFYSYHATEEAEFKFIETRYDIHGYPTFLVFRDGQLIDRIGSGPRPLFAKLKEYLD